jgi:hypothetical protein
LPACFTKSFSNEYSVAVNATPCPPSVTVRLAKSTTKAPVRKTGASGFFSA